MHGYHFLNRSETSTCTLGYWPHFALFALNRFSVNARIRATHITYNLMQQQKLSDEGPRATVSATRVQVAIAVRRRRLLHQRHDGTSAASLQGENSYFLVGLLDCYLLPCSACSSSSQSAAWQVLYQENAFLRATIVKRCESDPQLKHSEWNLLYKATWSPMLEAASVWLTYGRGFDNVRRERKTELEGVEGSSNLGLGPANASASKGTGISFGIEYILMK